MVVPSLVAVVLGFVALSATNGSIALFFATFAIMAIVGAGSATPTFSRIINRTFVRARGTALGIGLVGTGLASSLAPLLIAPVIAGYGWRAGYLCLAAIVGVAIPVIALLTRQGSMAPDIIVDRPIKMTGMVLSKALRDPLLWTLIAIFFLIALAASGLIVHFVPLLIDQGVPAQRAAAVASLIGVALIAARVGTGILLDSFFAPRVAAALMALGAVGLGVLAIGGAPYAVFGAIAIGLTFGAEFDLAGYLCARYFGMRAYGRLYGLCYSSVLAGTALSPLLYGVLRDALGSYTVVLLLSSAALLVSAGLFLTLRPFDAPPAAMPDDNNERKAFVTTILPEEAG